MILYDLFSSITEPRHSRTLRYSLAQVLTMSMLSYLCGSTGYRGIKRFCDAHADLLTEFLDLTDGIPSHVTIRDVLQRVSQKHLLAAFHTWTSSLADLEGHWLSGDGKALCSTVSDCHGKKQGFEAVVSLFAHESGLVKAMGHYRNQSKESGEQSELRFLLSELEGMGAVITLDALHTQKKR